MVQEIKSIALNMAIRQFELAIELVAPDRIISLTPKELLFRPAQNRNHIYWLFGHIVTFADFAPYLSNSTYIIDPSYRTLFGMGSVPSDSAYDYPPISEIISQFEKATGNDLEALHSMSESDLSLPPAVELSEPLRQYFPDRASLVVGSSMHTAYHAGQIGTVLKILGK